ncbi:MAG: hypothetical protein AABZ44_04400 [Elusimicrobiota bacterium]
MPAALVVSAVRTAVPPTVPPNVVAVVAFTVSERVSTRSPSKVLLKAAVVVLSDGVETRRLEAPLTRLVASAVIFGKRAATDLSIEQFRLAPAIFARDEVPFSLRLSYPAGLKDEVPLTVKDLASKEVLWRGSAVLSGTSPEEFRFSLTAPRRLGKRRLQVEAAVGVWDKVAVNNSASVTTEVVRNKLRVLYLCGKPGFDYGYLRELVRADASRELVSFVILRNMEDVPPYGETELSLIPFPAHEIFTQNLDEFDLFILQDFSFERFGLPSAYLTHVKDFVRSGGGLVFIAGGNTAADSAQQNSFLNEIFGLTVERSEVAAAKGIFRIDDAAWWQRVFVAQGDYRGPAFGGSSVPRSSAQGYARKDLESWQQVLSPVEVAVTAKPVAGARAKVIASDDSPLLAYAELGQGRALWVGFAGQWLIKVRQAMQGEIAGHYERFWEGLFTWVTRSAAEEIGGGKMVDAAKTEDEAVREMRRSYDEGYLSALAGANRGRLLAESAEWRQGIPREHGDALLASMTLAVSGRDASLDGSAAGGGLDPVLLGLGAAAALIVEWWLRRRYGVAP